MSNRAFAQLICLLLLAAAFLCGWACYATGGGGWGVLAFLIGMLALSVGESSTGAKL